MADEQKIDNFRQAIADYLECPVEEVGNFMFGCERQSEGTVSFSGGWTAIGHWYLIGMCEELRAMLERNRPQPQETAVPQLALPPELAEMLKRGGN